MKIKAIVGAIKLNDELIISVNDKLPLNCPNDLKYFREMTTNSIIVMGSKTWDTLPKRPLPNRKNAVLSNRVYTSIFTDEETMNPNILHYYGVGSTDDLLKRLEQDNPEGKDVWIIGGAEVYKFFAPIISEWHLTLANKDDTYEIDEKSVLTQFSFLETIIGYNPNLKAVKLLDDKHSVLIYSR